MDKKILMQIADTLQHQINEIKSRRAEVVAKKERLSSDEVFMCQYLDGLSLAYHLTIPMIHASCISSFNLFSCFEIIMSEIYKGGASARRASTNGIFVGKRIGLECCAALVMSVWKDALVIEAKKVLRDLSSSRMELLQQKTAVKGFF